jgi:hypothetical protein
MAQDSAITVDPSREAIIAAIRKHADRIAALGAISLYLFGSRARGDSRPDSDLDVFVDYQPGSGFSALDLIGIKHIVEDELGLSIHITTRTSLRRDAVRAAVERDAVRVL